MMYTHRALEGIAHKRYALAKKLYRFGLAVKQYMRRSVLRASKYWRTCTSCWYAEKDVASIF